jgi:hypothetical protein
VFYGLFMERIDLAHQFGVDRQRRWRNAGSGMSWVVEVAFGRLADGRWYAVLTGSRHQIEDDAQGAHVFAANELGKTLAVQLAYRWMRQAGGNWLPTPAAYDNRGRPADGLPWVARGGEWHLER